MDADELINFAQGSMPHDIEQRQQWFAAQRKVRELARLGAAVEAMPDGAVLRRLAGDSRHEWDAMVDNHSQDGAEYKESFDTPLKALQWFNK